MCLALITLSGAYTLCRRGRVVVGYRKVAGIVKKNFGERIIIFNSGVFPVLGLSAVSLWESTARL